MQILASPLRGCAQKLGPHEEKEFEMTYRATSLGRPAGVSPVRETPGSPVAIPFPGGSARNFLNEVYDFRNTYIAHVKQELTDRMQAEQSLHRWIEAPLKLRTGVPRANLQPTPSSFTSHPPRPQRQLVSGWR